MIAASVPAQRRPDAKLLSLDRLGCIRHHARSEFPDLLKPGDLVVANDAATLPASLHGTHIRTGYPIEVRLAGRAAAASEKIGRFLAVIFGAGDYHVRTEARPLPPALAPGDRLALGPLAAKVERLLNHPRFVLLQLEGSSDEIWAGLAHHGRPIQYAHVPEQLDLWDVWTPIAGQPVAFEPPSAGFVLDWRMMHLLVERKIRFASITHAAGISSTGDADLDALLPFDEPYRISEATSTAVRDAVARGGRIVAIGTTVVRALERAAMGVGLVRAGPGIANQRIGPNTRLTIVDAILSGTHEPGTSHYDLLHAFVDESTMQRIDEELEATGYRTHEFGDSVFIERSDIPTPAEHRRAHELAGFVRASPAERTLAG